LNFNPHTHTHGNPHTHGSPGSSYRSVNWIGLRDLAWFSSVFWAPPSSVFMVLLLPSWLYVLVSWAWWDWP